MEFQDRRRRSLRVQFWLLVEGLKDPLEDTDSDADTALPQPAPSTIATTREDIKMIWNAHFSTNALNSNQKYIRTVKAFVEGDASALVTAQDLRRVRHAVFAAQRDVLAEMEEEDFPEFAKSDLYFKALADFPDLTPTDHAEAFALSSTLQPRPRALSHPHTPPPRPPPPQIHRSASPPPLRASSPPPAFGIAKPRHLQRTDTAPPQVTLQAVFDQRPTACRTGSDNGMFDRGPARKASIGSLDSGGPGKRRSVFSDSLEFLMSSPDAGQHDEFRSPLFDDEGSGTEAEGKEGGTTISEDVYVQVQTIEAIQEALNSILSTDARGASQAHRSTASLATMQEPTGRRPSVDLGMRRPPSKQPWSPVSGTPTGWASSGSSGKFLPEERRRGKGVFDDNEDMDDLEPEDVEPEFDPKSIRLAAPGDLQLPIEIARLAATIDKLRNQEAVVGALIRKAELTGIASELKILTKSRESLRREMRALTFQKSQFESQESENKLMPGRTSVIISGTTVGQADGQSFQLYLVEVHQLASDGTFGSGWIVTRRYSEFAILHANLREKYLAARQLDFPSKRLVASCNEGFIEQRKAGLEKYLQVRSAFLLSTSSSS
jgi:sorting nexin-25